MAFLSLLSLIVGVATFIGGAVAVFSLGRKAVGHLIDGDVGLACKYLILAALAIGTLALCRLLISAQPVEWPWAPWHIPFYIVADLVLFLLLYVAPKFLTSE